MLNILTFGHPVLALLGLGVLATLFLLCWQQRSRV